MKSDRFYRLTGRDVLENLINLRQITFEVTDGCNLKCKYCGYGELYEGYDTRESKFLPAAKARAILDYLFDIWKNYKAKGFHPCVYISFYGGEPLLNMDLIRDIIGYVGEKSIGIDREFMFTMTTNAVLLDRHMDYLKEKNVRLLISLDGDREGQSYRVDHSGKNSFDKVFGNIKTLQKKYPEYFDRQVNFNSVLHNRNSVKKYS